MTSKRIIGLTAAASTLLLTACSFNKIFLQPDKAPATAKRLTLAAPGDTTVVFFDGDNHQPTFTKNRRDTIDRGYTIESVVFKSGNGNKLNGWLLKPKNTKADISIFHLHGNAGFLLNHYTLIAPLIKNGFQVFMFDYSGYGFSEGNASRENALTDALSAFDYFKERPEIKNTQRIIYGQSLGGHLSAVVGTMRQKEIDGLVIEGAFSSHNDIAAYRAPVIGRIFVKQGYSAKRSIEDFHKPLLVIHSTEDKTIPFFMGKRIYEHANQPKEFYEIKHEHIRGPVFYTDEISNKIKNMIAGK